VRQLYKFDLREKKDLVKQLLSKSDGLEYIAVLDSNSKRKPTNLPSDYINYDVIIGVDAIDVLKVKANSLESLKQFHNKNRDWLFGFISYDLKNELEELESRNIDNFKIDNLSFFVPKYVLTFKGNELSVLTFESKEETSLFLNSLSGKTQEKNVNIELKSRDTKAEYLDKINEIKQHIQRGDIYEMNYCQEYYAKNVNINSAQVFQRLTNSTATPFSAFLKLKELNILSASPERFITKKGNNVLSQPIKGTRRRGESIQEDKQLILELENSEKDISENIMITDLVRNDLSITAEKGSVNVDELCKVYTFEKVHQMITSISSKVSSDLHFTELLASTFPMGSMTGAPKIRAMELIEKFEEFKRGIFSGAVGYITPNGDFDFNVVIRTILYNSSTKYLSVGVGGAITIKSNAEEEYEECKVKVKPILEILNN
jgi:para-aminobenzoate synthetase component 1